MKSIISGTGKASLDDMKLVILIDGNNTVTAKSGSTTKTAIGTKDTFGFTDIASGTWTISATNGSETVSQSVIVGSTKQVIRMFYNVIPQFTYTGNYAIVDDLDNPITQSSNNWKIKFLTSGTLTFSDLRGAKDGIDIFLVGGGGGSPYGYIGESEPMTGGGGSGYTRTINNFKINYNTEYEIEIGSGGSEGLKANETGKKGGSSIAFGSTASGGKPSSNTRGGNGGSGGSGSGISNGGGIDGNDGGNGEYPSWAGGKGQRSTPGPNGETGSTREFGEETGILYATGGYANRHMNPIQNTGNGGDGSRSGDKGYAGASGIVIIRNKR